MQLDGIVWWVREHKLKWTYGNLLKLGKGYSTLRGQDAIS